MTLKLGYLIVTYNGQDSIRQLLESIPDKQDTLIVDNASTDSTLAIGEECQVEVIKNSINRGYGAAINQGMAYFINKKYTHVFVLNQDVVLKNKVETRLIASLQEYAIVQPLILLPDGNVNVDQLVMNMLGYVYPLNFGKIPLDPPLEKGKKNQKLMFFSGAAFIINLEKYQQIGPLDESLFLYYEDIDYALRCHLQNEKIGFLPELVLVHHYISFRKNREKQKMLTLNRTKIINRYFTDRWRRWLGVKIIPEETSRYTGQQQKILSTWLQKHAVLGFYTRQLPVWQRGLINLLIVPYSWFMKIIL